MLRWLCLSAAVVFAVAPVQAGSITGQYIEARTCEVFTGPCFANADTSLTGRHAVLGWKVEQGSFDNVALDGLGIVAVISSPETLGLNQVLPVKALLIVDAKATAEQRAALIAMARKQTGDLLKNVVDVQTAAITLDTCACKENGCAKLTAGPARIETRCINAEHDKSCDNAFALYPPLTKGLGKVRAAVAEEHVFDGKGFNETWKDHSRRGAYLGAFEMN